MAHDLDAGGSEAALECEPAHEDWMKVDWDGRLGETSVVEASLFEPERWRAD